MICPDFAIYTSYLNHYEGYIRESLKDMGLLDYALNINSLSFFINYSGCVLCFHAKDANVLSNIEGRKYKIILLSHQLLPVGDRSFLSSAHADYLICNGSRKLIEQLNLTGVKHIINACFFPAMYALSEGRDPKSVFVQITTDREGKEYGSTFTRNALCRWLLDKGYTVNYFEHCHHSDPETVPEGVRRVKPGKDYMQTLSVSKYFIGHGTTTPLTNTFIQGAVNICTSTDWLYRQTPILREALEQCSYFIDNFDQLAAVMRREPKYGEAFTSYLFGDDRQNIGERIKEILLKINWHERL